MDEETLEALKEVIGQLKGGMRLMLEDGELFELVARSNMKLCEAHLKAGFTHSEAIALVAAQGGLKFSTK